MTSRKHSSQLFLQKAPRKQCEECEGKGFIILEEKNHHIVTDYKTGETFRNDVEECPVCNGTGWANVEEEE